jgi:uncharacterized protein Usg
MDRNQLWLLGYRLTTAEILYHMPDHAGLLQTFVWQDLDLAPRFPMLRGFLGYWEKNLEGKLHSVLVASSSLIRPQEIPVADLSLTLH